MRVLIAAQDGGVGWYRLRQPAKHLVQADEGVEIEFERRLPVLTNEKERRVEILVDADVVVLQLPMQFWIPEAIRNLQKRGVAVVVEIDDDHDAVYPTHQAISIKSNPVKNPKFLRECCKIADLVTCSTPELARLYAPHGRVAVLPNYVSPEWLAIRRPSTDGLTAGWTGAVGVHPSDLQATRGAVGDALREVGGRFLHIGSKESAVQVGLGLDGAESAGWVDYELYPLAISRMDVGIVPLAYNRFNRSKSWLKGLEYAALGIPFVASNLPEYVALADDYHVGRLAGTPKQWKQRMLYFLRDPSEARRMGQAYREVVAEYLTADRHAWRWAEAWQQAFLNRMKNYNPAEVVA